MGFSLKIIRKLLADRPDLLAKLDGKVKSRKPAAREGGMNRTEQRFASAVLDPLKRSGDIDDWSYEAERFRLADNTWSKWDFRVTLAGGQNVFVEVKVAKKDGSILWTDDSAVKTKTIPELHPYVFYLAVLHPGSEWAISRLPSRKWGNLKCGLRW